MICLQLIASHWSDFVALTKPDLGLQQISLMTVTTLHQLNAVTQCRFGHCPLCFIVMLVVIVLSFVMLSVIVLGFSAQPGLKRFFPFSPFLWQRRQLDLNPQPKDVEANVLPLCCPCLH